MQHRGLRRILAVLALLGGLAMAWWQTREKTQYLQIAWLLTHVAVEADGLVLDRGRLTALGWQVAGQKSANWLHFQAGQAPEATREVEVTLPAEVHEITVFCRFELLPGGPQVRSRTRVGVPAQASGRLTVDVEACGVRER